MKKKMNHKLILAVFVVLLLAAMVPTQFTTTPDPIFFGWLPGPLLYWWALMAVNLVFVLVVAKQFVESDEGEDDE